MMTEVVTRQIMVGARIAVMTIERKIELTTTDTKIEGLTVMTIGMVFFSSISQKYFYDHPIISTSKPSRIK